MTDEKALALERKAKLARCEAAIGHEFQDRSLLELALTHSSLKDAWTPSNERLEYLGDSVIGLAVAEHLFLNFPDLQEGELTRIKSVVVSRAGLAKLGRALDLQGYLRVGKGLLSRRALPPSLLANCLEALVGAIYLDAGFEAARARVLEWIDRPIRTAAARRDARNWKAELQHAAQRQLNLTPRYQMLEAVGPDHKKEFAIVAIVGERKFPQGRGSTKKQAEQRAARLALKELKGEVDGESDAKADGCAKDADRADGADRADAAGDD